MKKTLVLLLSVVFVLAMTSCQKQPTAAFTASKTNATVNETIVFTNTSKDGSKYEWNFGDGAVSSTETAVHTYTTAGTYNVKLKVSSKNGKKSDEATSLITVTGGGGNNSISHDGNTYTLADGALVFWGDYYSMGNGNYELMLFSSGLSYSSSLSGVGDLLYIDLLTPAAGIVASNYTYDPQNTYATYTFTNSSAFLVNYDVSQTTVDETIEFNSGTITIAISGTQYTITINLTDANSNALTGSYEGTLTYNDNSKKANLIKNFLKIKS